MSGKGPKKAISRRPTFGAEEARTHLPELLERAQRGSRTVITRHGKPVAVLAPVGDLSRRRGPSLLALKGTGAGLWGPVPAHTVAAMRDEWE